MRLACCVLSALLVSALPAAGQTLRSTVVPGDATVVIPPRGQPMPSLAAPPRRMPSEPVAGINPAPPPLPLAAAPMPLGAVPGLLLPLAAGILLGTGLPGGGGGGSAPATTTR
jgi:hypothetical protein